MRCRLPRRTSLWAWVGFCSLAVATARAEAPNVLILRPVGAGFEDAEKGLREASGEEFSWTVQVVTKETKLDELQQIWKSTHPRAVVAMDNRSIAFSRDLRGSLSDVSTPLVGIMGVRIDGVLGKTANAMGINYEIPAVTAFVNLRSLLKCPIRKIGVVYRPIMAEFIRANAELCSKEHFELVGIELEITDKSNPSEALQESLEDLLHKKKVDALWVPNDNAFLNPVLLKEVWIPTLANAGKPVLVGVEALAQPKFNFGSFALVPDAYALGNQASEILQELKSNHWEALEPRVDMPLSVVKTINLSLLQSACSINQDRLGEIDKILK